MTQIQNGNIVIIEVGGQEWTSLLEGMKIESSKLIILPSESIASDIGIFPTNKLIAIKLKLVKKVVPPKTTVKKPVSNKVPEEVPSNEDTSNEVPAKVETKSRLGMNFICHTIFQLFYKLDPFRPKFLFIKRSSFLELWLCIC